MNSAESRYEFTQVEWVKVEHRFVTISSIHEVQVNPNKVYSDWAFCHTRAENN